MKHGCLFATSTLAIAISACQANAPAAPTGAAAPAAVPTEVQASTAAAPAAAVALSPKQREDIAIAVMKQQYGDNFNTAHSCWEHAVDWNGDTHEYCMTLNPTHQVKGAHGTRLYVQASSLSQINDDPRYSYGHVDPGLMGAFQVQINSPTDWNIVAANKAMDFGTIGDCGCADARFVQLGPDYYGWMFTSGGTWQGVSVVDYSLIAPQEDTFKDISKIPRVTETAQDVEYEIAIDRAAADQTVFPLLVTTVQKGTRSAPIKVNFDTQKWQYALPATP